MNGDQTLASLDATCEEIADLEQRLDACRKVRDRLILNAHNAKLEGYRKLGKRTHLTHGRISQIIKEQRKLARIFGPRVTSL